MNTSFHSALKMRTVPRKFSYGLYGQQLPKNRHGRYTWKWLSDMVVADRQGVIR